MAGTGVELNMGVVAFGLFMSVGVALYAGNQLAAASISPGSVDAFSALSVTQTVIEAFLGWVIPGCPWFLQVPLTIGGLTYWIYLIVVIVEALIP